VSNDGERTAPVSGVGTADADDTTATVGVHRIADFDVRVVPPDGARLDAFHGWLFDPSSDVKPFFRVDEDGDRLRFIEAAVGRPLIVRVWGTCDGERTLETSLDVRADGGPYEVRLVRGLALDGIVERGDGTPVPACRVRCAQSPSADDSEDVTTGLDGRFRITGLAAGTWFVTAGSGALECPVAVEAISGTRDVRVVVVPKRAPL